MSIRLKLAIMFLAIASIPLLFVSALTFTNYKKSLEANRFAQLRDLTIFRADRIDAYFAGLKAHIEISQGFYNIKKNLPILTRLADDLNNPEFIAAKKMLDAQLQQMQSVSDLADIMLINPQGKVVYAIRPGHYSKDMSNGIDAEQKVFAEGKNRIYFSDVYFDAAEDKRFEMLLAAPATDFNDAFIGVIAFEIDMTPVYKLIQDTTGLGNTGEVLIGKKAGNQVEYLNPLRHDPNAALKRKIDIGGEAGRPMQEAVQGRTGSGLSTDYRGKKVIAAWRYIPSLDWGLVAKIDTKEAFADVTNLRNLAIALLLIVIVLSGIMAFSIAHSISEPIKRLSEGAAIVGSGNLDYKLGTNQKDEIGQLSRSFDKMTLDLKQTTASRDELNREIAERKKTEETLRESEERLTQAMGVSELGSWGLDTRSGKAWRSLRHDQIFGYPELLPEWTYKMFLDHVLPEDRKQVDEKYGQSLAKGGEWNFECRIRRSDGAIRWIWAQGKPRFNDRNEVVQLFGLVQDITERKKAEEALRQSEERYRTLFETMLEGFCIIEVVFDAANKPVDYRFLDINPAFENQTGLHNAKGKLMRELAPAHEKHWFEIYGKIALTGEPARFENEARALNRWYDVSAVRVGGPESRKVAILFNDISERKRAEEALKKSHDEQEIRVKERTADLNETLTELQKQVAQRIRAEEAFRSASLYSRGLLEASLDPLVTISPEGKITDVNKATEAVTGISRERLIGSDFSDYFTEPDKARDGYKKVLSEGMVIDYPLTIRHTSGHTTDVLYNATVYKNPAGEIQGVFAAARDITEKKAAEAELEKYRLHLEDLVKNRTEELSRSNKDLEQFAYVASHDLQEPLRAVSGFVELLRRNLEKSLDEKTSEYMNFSIEGAKRMQLLINGLLEYSRVGTQGKKPQKVNSKEAFDEALARLQASILESGAKITADDLPVIYFDDMQLARLFQNLIGNAIKFRGDQPPQIHVSAVRQDAGWRFAVCDNGIGIEPQYADRIFQIFQRLHTRKTYPGTGIGLSICKKIVERHGGKIWVESAQKQGSTFYFTVPDIEGA
jgi:PAS domain S-box-containing protein